MGGSMTIRDCFNIAQTITPAIAHFERSKIDRFKQRYGRYMEDATNKIAALNQEYLIYEDGAFKRTDDGGYQFKEGKNKFDYDELMDKILSRPV